MASSKTPSLSTIDDGTTEHRPRLGGDRCVPDLGSGSDDELPCRSHGDGSQRLDPGGRDGKDERGMEAAGGSPLATQTSHGLGAGSGMQPVHPWNGSCGLAVSERSYPQNGGADTAKNCATEATAGE